MKIVKMTIECEDGAVLEWSTANGLRRCPDGYHVTADDGGVVSADSPRKAFNAVEFLPKRGPTFGLNNFASPQ